MKKAFESAAISVVSVIVVYYTAHYTSILVPDAAYALNTTVNPIGILAGITAGLLTQAVLSKLLN